jgi:hypothetical protein
VQVTRNSVPTRVGIGTVVSGRERLSALESGPVRVELVP